MASRIRLMMLPDPDDSYGISKLEAEQGLRVIAAETGMALVIIRPVLVYGPGLRLIFEHDALVT